MRARLAISVLAAAVILSCSKLSTEAKSSGFTLEQRQDRVDILLDGRPFTAFHFHAKWDKPFLYPLRTLGGSVLSRGWPVEPREGDEQDHAWHRGIWYGHGDINGEDFWREKPDRSTARLVVEGQPKLSPGSKAAVEANLGMIGAKNNRIGSMRQSFEFQRDDSRLRIAATVAISASEGAPLRFGDTDDGGFGFRLATEFRQNRGAELTNSDGLQGTEKIWGKPAKWVQYKAAVNGKPAGVVVFDHPSNLRHPTGWHARGYSLCSANPFAARSFSNDKSRDGSYTLPAGQTLTLRYLVVIFDGDLPRASADQIFAQFSKE